MLAYFRQVNTWTAIAVLALLGWLADSLVWFLETHPLTLAGLVTYLGHSWYAVPLLLAIVVILRLRRPAELLSLTIYDERGAPLYRQGGFRLDEPVLDPILASFRGTTQDNGLHCLTLSTGTTVYFLRQGGLVLVACFSGPPQSTQLEAGLRLLQQQELPTEDFFRNLPPDVAALAAHLLNAPVERDLLANLWLHRRMTMTSADLASQVGYPEEAVLIALEKLAESALVHRQDVCQMTFYRLADDEVRLARLDQVIAWQARWLARARRVEQLIGPTRPGY